MSIACQQDNFPIVQYLHNHGAAQDVNTPSWQQQTPLQITCKKNHLHIVQWLIQQGTPTKTNISTWLTKLNAQNRKILFQQAIANRDVAHESFIALACVVRNGHRSHNLVHALDTGLLLDKISSYVEGIRNTRSLWYHIVRQGP
jgi:ankyrin repeat protein